MDRRKAVFMNMKPTQLHKSSLSDGSTFGLIFCFSCFEIFDNFIFDFVVKVCESEG